MTGSVDQARGQLDGAISRGVHDAARWTESTLADQITLERARREARRLVDAEERPPAELPELLTLRERLQLPQEPTTWRVERWQPVGGRVVLAAQYKAGKTTLVGNLVRSLVDGDPFLDAARVHPVDGAVMILDFEMTPRQADRWLGDQRIKNDDRVILAPLRGRAAAFDPRDTERRGEWVELLRQRGVSYLVLDCLRPVLDALGLDENKDAGRFLTALDALLSEADIPEALVVHHMGHSGERARGDSRLRDWPDVEWRLVREDPDNPTSPRYISALGRDVDVSECRLAFDEVTRRLTPAGGSRRDAAFDEAYGAVWALLTDTPDQSGNAIELALNPPHARKVVRSVLARSVESGLLVREKGERNSWLYRVAASSSPVQPSSTQLADEVEASSSPPFIEGRTGELDDLGKSKEQP